MGADARANKEIAGATPANAGLAFAAQTDHFSWLGTGRNIYADGILTNHPSTAAARLTRFAGQLPATHTARTGLAILKRALSN